MTPSSLKLSQQINKPKEDAGNPWLGVDQSEFQEAQTNSLTLGGGSLAQLSPDVRTVNRGPLSFWDREIFLLAKIYMMYKKTIAHVNKFSCNKY